LTILDHARAMGLTADQYVRYNPECIPLIDVLYADPAWHFKNYSADAPGKTHERTRGAAKHYPTMTTLDTAALPMGRLCSPNSVCLMWTTMTHLEDALYVLRHWDFTYKTVAFTWVKPNRGAVGRFIEDITSDRNWALGMGYSTRANAEICLLGTRGKGLPRQSAAVRSLLVRPLTRHSEKPFDTYGRINTLYGDTVQNPERELVKLELFARTVQPGWYAIGNALDPDADMRDILWSYARDL
jgi:N6-adenosine-specific RNA methylase IME4